MNCIFVGIPKEMNYFIEDQKEKKNEENESKANQKKLKEKTKETKATILRTKKEKFVYF
jgi:hypothetical protein